jgi:transposase
MFLNQRRNRIKLLYWDTDGIAIWMKRLERGCFQSPTNEPQPARCLKDDPGTSLAL